MDRITVTFRKSDSDYFATAVFTMVQSKETRIREMVEESSSRVELKTGHEMLPQGRIVPRGAGILCYCGILWALRNAGAFSGDIFGYAVTIEEFHGFLDHPDSREIFCAAGRAGVALYLERPELAEMRWGDDWRLTEYSVSIVQ